MSPNGVATRLLEFATGGFLSLLVCSAPGSAATANLGVMPSPTLKRTKSRRFNCASRSLALGSAVSVTIRSFRAFMGDACGISLFQVIQWAYDCALGESCYSSFNGASVYERDRIKLFWSHVDKTIDRGRLRLARQRY